MSIDATDSARPILGVLPNPSSLGVLPNADPATEGALPSDEDLPKGLGKTDLPKGLGKTVSSLLDGTQSSSRAVSCDGVLTNRATPAAATPAAASLAISKTSWTMRKGVGFRGVFIPSGVAFGVMTVSWQWGLSCRSGEKNERVLAMGPKLPLGERGEEDVEEDVRRRGDGAAELSGEQGLSDDLVLAHFGTGWSAATLEASFVIPQVYMFGRKPSRIAGVRLRDPLLSIFDLRQRFMQTKIPNIHNWSAEILQARTASSFSAICWGAVRMLIM